jgi:hypothetical protein
MAKTLNARPSSLLGISDPFIAFCTDRACYTLATLIENDMDEAENRLPSSAKSTAHTKARQRVLDQYLGTSEVIAPGRFRPVT